MDLYLIFLFLSPTSVNRTQQNIWRYLDFHGLAIHTNIHAPSDPHQKPNCVVQWEGDVDNVLGRDRTQTKETEKT